MTRTTSPRFQRFAELFRFYQAAIVNTIFGFSLYALLIWIGLDRYLAQALAFVCGVMFNYFTYSRHVFRDGERAKGRFALAYGVNYVLNLSLLALVSTVIHNPYIAGFIASPLASVVNYLALRHLVFVRRPPS